MTEAEVVVVGAGLSGLVAATEIADGGRRVLLLEREGEQDLGAQAWWSFGGLFLVAAQIRTHLFNGMLVAEAAGFGNQRPRSPGGQDTGKHRAGADLGQGGDAARLQRA